MKTRYEKLVRNLGPLVGLGLQGYALLLMIAASAQMFREGNWFAGPSLIFDGLFGLIAGWQARAVWRAWKA